MSILGAHMSIAGGYGRAVERARQAGCDCLQIFTRNNQQWRAKPITPLEVESFRRAMAEQGIGHPLVHDSYLINLASPDPILWRKSLEAFVLELERAEQLGIPYVVTHPGSATDDCKEAGLRRVAKALDEVHRRTRSLRVRCLLENTAGQGSSLGGAFEHLAAIIERVKEPDRLGICLDTCHAFAAGYALASAADYRRTMRAVAATVGLDRVRAFHLNDSQRELGSRVDRHAHIGRGRIGLDGFRRIVNDPHFRRVPMYLETPKGEEQGTELDTINLAVLRGLEKSKGRPRIKAVPSPPPTNRGRG